MDALSLPGVRFRFRANPDLVSSHHSQLDPRGGSRIGVSNAILHNSEGGWKQQASERILVFSSILETSVELWSKGASVTARDGAMRASNASAQSCGTVACSIEGISYMLHFDHCRFSMSA